MKIIYFFLISSFLLLNSCNRDVPEINYTGAYSWELITEIEGVNIDKAFQLHVDKDNVLWVGTFGNGLIKIDGESITQLTTENSAIPDNLIYAID